MGLWEHVTTGHDDTPDEPREDATSGDRTREATEPDDSSSERAATTPRETTPHGLVSPDAGLRYVLEARTLEVDGDHVAASSLVLVTDTNVVLAADGDERGTQEFQIPLRDSTTVSREQDLLRWLHIDAPKHSFSVDVTFCARSNVEDLVTVLEQPQPVAESTEMSQPVDTDTSEVAVEIIERLAALRDDDAITEEEFDVKKDRLLKHI